MPNTLVHAGIQGLVTRSIIKDADLKWIYLSAIIPDLPWIFQRIVTRFPGVNPFDLRLYTIVQASLFFCLILSTAFASLSREFCKTGLILASGSLFHLLLDALQIKWANGVHLFAPFSWQLSNFGFFWPESLPTYTATAFGLAYLIFHFKASIRGPFPIHFKMDKRLLAAFGLFMLYFLLPFFLLHGPENQDNHFLKTLRSVDDRAGKTLEVDRGFYEPDPSGGQLSVFGGAKLKVRDFKMKQSARLSIRGTFLDKETIIIHEHHVHSMFRDWASYLGLGLLATFWMASCYQQMKKNITNRL